MKIERKTLKRLARRNIREAHPSPIAVTLLFLLLTSGISMLVDFVVANPAAMIYRVMYVVLNGGTPERLLDVLAADGGTETLLTVFLNILIFLYLMVLSFGYSAYTLHRTDGEHSSCGDLLCGFSQVARVVLMRLAVLAFTAVWGMATVIPAAIAGSIGLAAVTLVFGQSMTGVVIGTVFFYAVMIAAVLLAAYLAMRYALAPYILADDPRIGGMEAVRRSRILLRGRLGEVFKLSFSFAGWELLGMLIVGAASFAVYAFVAQRYLATGDSLALGLGAYALVIVNGLIALPYNMWYLAYREGTFVQYYRALSPKRADVRSVLEADRPEPF